MLFLRRIGRIECWVGSIFLNTAVKAILGLKGCNVVPDKSGGAPRITKDGVIAAKEIELERQV